MGAIDKARYEIMPIGITKEGRWLASGDPLRALSSGEMAESHPAILLAEPSQRGLVRLDKGDEQQSLTAVELGQIDVVFPILHGPYGEDGTMQGLLELAGFPYVGAGVAASAVGMDKILFKDVMRSHGLPVVPTVALKRSAWEEHPEAVLGKIEEEIGYDCFIKPANLGSSVGITKAHDRSELCDALDTAARFDRKILVEVAIDAREIELSVLGNDHPVASMPGEIVPSNEFYDYEAKYLDGESDLLIPAPIPAETTQLVQRLAVEAYKAIDCAGMARVDFLLERGTNEVYLNELNTLPGFTPISMYSKLWEASGLSYTDLIHQLIELALERFQDKSRTATSYQLPDREQGT